jgi:hypothetical protein
MVAAGLLDDSRVMLPRLNRLLERLMAATAQPNTATQDEKQDQPKEEETKAEATKQ